MKDTEIIQEWKRQSDYDLETARHMFKSGRYIYCVFMCHLTIEKILKAHYYKTINEPPPKIHNLIYFIEKCELTLPQEIYDFIFTLNRVSIPTRYPESLKNLLRSFNKQVTKEIFTSTKNAQKWLKEKL